MVFEKVYVDVDGSLTTWSLTGEVRSVKISGSPVYGRRKMVTRVDKVSRFKVIYFHFDY